MRGKRLWAYLIVMVATAVALGSAGQGQRAAALEGLLGQPAHINAGDLLIDLGMACGSEECFGNDSDGFDILAPGDGGYKGTLRLSGSASSGVEHLAFEDSGRIIASTGADVGRYGHSGGPRTTIIPEDTEDYPFLVSYDLDVPENIYAAVSVGGEQKVWFYERFGVAYGSPVEVPVATLDEGLGLEIVGLFGCTLTYGGSGQLKRYDICLASQLSDYPVAPGANQTILRVLDDGSVLTADGGQAHRIELNGTVTDYGDANTCYVSADAYDGILYAVDTCAYRVDALDLDAAAFDHLVVTYDEADLTVRDAYPIGVRVYNRVAPPKPVIFVHGITTNFRVGNFDAIFNGMAITRFAYFQDADAAACGTRQRPTLLPATTGASLSTVVRDSTSGPGAHCDSQSDLAVNSALLHQDIQELYYSSGGQRTILVGFSMGGAIIRGALSYSESLQDGIGGTMVDSVFFFESAHDGSYWATCLTAGRCPGELPATFIDLINGSPWGPQISTSRPAVHQLTPGSPWYQWANSHLLPDIGYYNFYGDIRYTEETSWAGFHRRTKVWFGIGDLVFYPGPNSDPYDSPVGGAARFSRPDTTEQWEWAFKRAVLAKVDDRIAAGLSPGAVDDANKSAMTFAAAVTLGLPELHTNLPSHLGDSGPEGSYAALNIVQCGTQATLVSPAEQARLLIISKLGGEPFRCPGH